MTPKWTPRGSQNQPKIDENPHLDPKAPHWVAQGGPLGGPGGPGPPKWCPKGAKMVPQGAKRAPQSSKMEPPSLPRGRFGCPTRPSPEVCRSYQSCQFCKSCQSCQSPINWLLDHIASALGSPRGLPNHPARPREPPNAPKCSPGIPKAPITREVSKPLV